MELEKFSKFKSDNKYYNGNELLSKTDRNGKNQKYLFRRRTDLRVKLHGLVVIC